MPDDDGKLTEGHIVHVQMPEGDWWDEDDEDDLEDELTDQEEVVSMALAHARELRGEAGPWSWKDFEKIQADLEALPAKYYGASAFAGLPEMAVESLLYGIISDCKEVFCPDYRRVRLVWRVRVSKNLGRVVFGKCKLVPGKDRVLAQQAAREDELIAWWEITLALDAWVLMTPAERIAVLHHEVMHCDLKDDGSPALRGHDIEEFGATMLRHGLLDESRVRALAMGLRGARERVEGWEIGIGDEHLIQAWNNAGGGR